MNTFRPADLLLPWLRSPAVMSVHEQCLILYTQIVRRVLKTAVRGILGSGDFVHVLSWCKQLAKCISKNPMLETSIIIVLMHAIEFVISLD